MPKIVFENQIVLSDKGMNIRDLLLKNQINPYNGIAKYINCRGMGTCGTCAVRIEGKVSEKTRMEKWRLNFPPHNEAVGLRLACQCKVEGDLTIKKGDGLWGQKL